MKIFRDKRNHARKFFALISRFLMESSNWNLIKEFGIPEWLAGRGQFVIISDPDGDRDIVSSFRVVVVRDGANIRIQTLILTKVPDELQNRAFYLNSVRPYWDNKQRRLYSAPGLNISIAMRVYDLIIYSKCKLRYLVCNKSTSQARVFNSNK